MKKFEVLKEHLRPANNTQCFYCNQPLGSNHKDDCVMISKTVTIKLTIEYPITVPNSWTKQDIESHRNNGTWCASNAINELKTFDKNIGCLCNLATFKVVESVNNQEPFINLS